MQVAVPDTPARVHGLEEPKDPVAEPVDVNATVPAGVVGEALMSVTVAVQTDAWFTTTIEMQDTVVVVKPGGGGFTVMLAGEVVELPLCVESLGL